MTTVNHNSVPEMSWKHTDFPGYLQSATCRESILPQGSFSVHSNPVTRSE